MPCPEDLIFFDLETTGLFTGPGTLAFLAAFGRLAEDTLRVDQYLLLDYPGENDFLEAILGEFSKTSGGRPPLEAAQPLVVSYNGKSFDSQLLKIRCLMNGIRPPDYCQADLLHPARRLWKRVLPSCTQAAIETGILGLDRTGDTPGSMAPDIWFSFLKTGESSELLKVCDHNARDIIGLSRLLGALCEIAKDPLGGGKRFRCDPENLALRWRRAIHRYGEEAFGAGTAKTGEELLRAAAELGHLRAAYGYYRRLAIEAEWERKDPESALGYVTMFLALPAIQGSMEDEMFHRRERLLEKLKQKEERAFKENERSRRTSVQGERAMNIRLLTIEDYDAAYTLWKTQAGISLKTLDDSETGIRKFLERNPLTCFAAEENGELAGTILGGHDGRRGYIYHVAVKEHFRSRNIGRSLISAVEQAFVQEGINKAATVSFKTNGGVCRFLTACGYPIREELSYRTKDLNPENT
jgi:ribosomal protein S18 acetylase RimI-like enzyme